MSLADAEVRTAWRLAERDDMVALRRRIADQPPPADRLLQVIADRLDLLLVGDRVFGLVELSPDLLDALACVGADAAESEPDPDAEDDDPFERDDHPEDDDHLEDPDGAPWVDDFDALAAGPVTALPFDGHRDSGSQEPPPPPPPPVYGTGVDLIGVLRGKRVWHADVMRWKRDRKDHGATTKW